jgi:hypothetical protein
MRYTIDGIEKTLLILRCLAERGLEGRTTPIQATVELRKRGRQSARVLVKPNDSGQGQYRSRTPVASGPDPPEAGLLNHHTPVDRIGPASATSPPRGAASAMQFPRMALPLLGCGGVGL